MKNPTKRHSNKRNYNWALYRVYDEILLRLDERISGKVYDLGCGEAPYREWILGKGCTYVGVDWGASPHALRADIISDLNASLPIDDGVADTVLALEVLEHLCEPEKFLVEVNRIVKSGGSFILSVPFMWHIHEEPYDYYRFTKYGLHYLLDKAGFEDIKIYNKTGYWLCSVLKFNYQTRKLLKGPLLVRRSVEFLLTPLWFIGQYFAPFVDRVWRSEGETAGYFVVSRKA